MNQAMLAGRCRRRLEGSADQVRQVPDVAATPAEAVLLGDFEIDGDRPGFSGGLGGPVGQECARGPVGGLVRHVAV